MGLDNSNQWKLRQFTARAWIFANTDPGNHNLRGNTLDRQNLE
jgi:hypothetical protein